MRNSSLLNEETGDQLKSTQWRVQIPTPNVHVLGGSDPKGGLKTTTSAFCQDFVGGWGGGGGGKKKKREKKKKKNQAN